MVAWPGSLCIMYWHVGYPHLVIHGQKCWRLIPCPEGFLRVCKLKEGVRKLNSSCKSCPNILTTKRFVVWPVECPCSAYLAAHGRQVSRVHCGFSAGWVCFLRSLEGSLLWLVLGSRFLAFLIVRFVAVFLVVGRVCCVDCSAPPFTTP